jgi:hypothetical protein
MTKVVCDRCGRTVAEGDDARSVVYIRQGPFVKLEKDLCIGCYSELRTFLNNQAVSAKL